MRRSELSTSGRASPRRHQIVLLALSNMTTRKSHCRGGRRARSQRLPPKPALMGAYMGQECWTSPATTPWNLGAKIVSVPLEWGLAKERVCALESSASTHHVLGTLENADRITAKPEVCDALPAISSHPRCDVQRKPRCARSSPYFWHGTAAHSRIGWPSVNSTNPGFAVPAPSKA
ncbi:hypothetical protein F3P66_25870 (plasmid) [Agrobacterium fabrum]|uniref:Uncharacterized protein n=1 Tax=Agrobacterium fabrum (strain C58 / ATCC 33970) TaxID=176299 RepID=Q8UJC8_AGRFC|nr:hypothetical protein Atu5549 [Agrobacterium fabrum str. C58]QRM62486.1 hypothetical protein F3P66_24040 [Agrobacterium fabrum]QRM62776.1 hypothetical protein F3P66_25870 [Agrobacterium fabrum]TRB28245.1 hypothetical protein EXN51_16560 [Agrobacterium fabrum]